MTGRDAPLDAAWIAVKNKKEEALTSVLRQHPGVVTEHYQNDPSMRGWTLLHYAAFLDDHKFVRILLKHGANCQALTRDGETPLQLLNKHCKDKENSVSYSILKLPSANTA